MAWLEEPPLASPTKKVAARRAVNQKKEELLYQPSWKQNEEELLYQASLWRENEEELFYQAS